MYSSYVTDDMEVKDPKGLVKAKEQLEDDFNLIEDDGSYLNWVEWDGHKIEGYWYPETLKILTTIAPYVEGYVEFMYEEGYNFRILFKDGKVFFQKADLKWLVPEELKYEEK